MSELPTPGPTEAPRAPAGTEPGSTPAMQRPLAFHELGDFTTVDRRTLYLVAVALGIGVVGALVAVLLLGLIGVFTNLFYYHRLAWSFVSPAGNQLGFLAILVPVAGGLIVGVMARFGSERIRGHGIPEAIESILTNKSRIQPRMTVLKPVSSAVAIGTGGPFGAEGPIIMTGGSLGSLVAQHLHLSAAERKMLLVAGAAAGMAATFNTPLAAVLLAVELLLFEWRPRSLIPVGAASLMATVVRWWILGNAPLFPLASSPLPSVPLAAGALIIGASVGLVATVLTYTVYAFEDLFRRLPVHWMWWPAIAGVGVGIGGLIVPRALGVGYDTIGLLLAGGLGASAMLALVLVKGAIWSSSLGSGTSGGVLAPLLMMGAASGSLIGLWMPTGSVAFWALIGMGAILGGTMRVPFTGVVFVLELTHDLNALLPVFVGCLAAEAVTIFTLRRSILTEKVARRRVHAAREYAVDPLEITPIRSVMHTEIVPTSDEYTVGDVAVLASERSSKFAGYPLLDARGRVSGFVTKGQVADYLVEGGDPRRSIRTIAHRPPGTLDPDQPVRVGVALLAQYDCESLPVVDPEDPSQFLGVFAREDLFQARVLALEEEQERDRVLRITLPTLSLAGRPRWWAGPSADAPPPNVDEIPQGEGTKSADGARSRPRTP
ncbi:MAG TPA: chloride channel protein [Thermoplasmata archaeon]|nr:chloride channel protein [Thermoplasmata archaeon]